MDFLNCYQHNICLLDGPMETRLKYQDHITLANDFAIFDLIYDAKASQYLQELYRGDIAIAQKYHLPIILSIPTYRASEKYLMEHGYKSSDVTKINQDCFDFVNKIRTSIQTKASDIFICGPVGTKNDAYDANIALSELESQQYHQTQINVLAQAGVDLINIVTMSSLAEAIGVAKAAAQTHKPYTVGFLIDKQAKLLDGNDLRLAIETIDKVVNPKPLCYLLTCVHPTIAAIALQPNYPAYQRIKGIKANGSCKAPAELEAAQCALADPPDAFADEIMTLTKTYHWKIVGGCCGTDSTHLEAIARDLSAA